MTSLKSQFLAAAAGIALIAASGSAYAQAEKKLDAQGGAQVESKNKAGGAQVQGQGGAQTQMRDGAGGSTQMQGGTKTETQSGGSGTQTQSESGAKTGQDAQRPGQAQQPSQSGDRQAQQPGGDDKPAQLSSEQRTKISGTLRQKDVNLKRVERTNINFNLNVGSVVPRTVGLVPLPAPIVAVVPAYRGYLYIVVGDDLLIVHPRTYEIVAVIPA